MALQERNLKLDATGANVTQLHDVLTKAGVAVPAAEQSQGLFGAGTQEAVKQFQKQSGIAVTGVVDAATVKALNALATVVNPGNQSSAPPGYVVEGKVSSRVSAGVVGLRVVVVDKGVGGDATLAQTATDGQGAFQASFPDSAVTQRGKAQPDLQVRVYAVETFIGASDVRYNATRHEVLNVALDDQAASSMHSEHEVLTGAVAAHYKGKLGDLKEAGEQQDITYLANKTGWDARAVAMAALADQFSARTADASGAQVIPQPFFYALFRAGLPTSEDALYRADAKSLEGIWKQAVEQSVIPKASAAQIPAMVAKFQELSARKLLSGPAQLGVSSLSDMLAAYKFNDAQKTQFAQLYAVHGADMPAFWDSVSKVFGADTTNRLKIDGKLGLLTINNAALMQKVHAVAGANGLSSTVQLAQAGYHSADAWIKLLAPEIPIPKEIPGTAQEQRANYAAYLAAQVRLSHPTASVAEMVMSKGLPLKGPKGEDFSSQVHAFLNEHQEEFEIGALPVEQYLAQKKLQVAPEIVHHVKRIQRVYQITPTDKAMKGLIGRNVDAAQLVVRHDRDTFIHSFAADLGGEDQAAQTYDRSVQVHNAVLNIALAYVNARTSSAIGVHSPPKYIDPVPANPGDIIAYPTMESLFGSMDFCGCEDCRSILSPAAYLVDLLQFLWSDDTAWAAYAAKWKSSQGGHENAPYPYPNQKEFKDAGSPSGTEISPFEVLMSRRPDIQYLPLTCENTNTALPYIDMVNETLEYYIANGLTLQKNTLDAFQGYDTGGVASEDLLASPQHVKDSAYQTLLSQRFPAPLPFHQPLENLRRYFNKFEVPLAQAMEALRKDNSTSIDRTQTPPPPDSDYAWRDILMEELGLARAEYEILTNYPKPVPLSDIYGFPAGMADADVVKQLSNAKQFARRVGIHYEDLAALLGTRFINPRSDLIPKLEKLGVTIAQLRALHGSTQTGQAWLSLLPQPLPDQAEYGGNIEAWVKDPANYTNMMKLITLQIVPGIWAPNKAYSVGDCVRPASPSPESTIYYQCTLAGTSGATEPAPWPSNPGDTCHDGGTVWACLDVSNTASFDNLSFRYADPDKLAQNLDVADFVRILRFIRLWKKLGWTIEQTDAAICALYQPSVPAGTSFADKVSTIANLDSGFTSLIQGLGVAKRVMDRLRLKTDHDLMPLMACWSDIGTHGDFALYRQMFLNPVMLKQDKTFDDNGYGEFLANPSEKLADHANAVRSAFNLAGDEYDRIMADLGYDASTPLTISNISAIYRRGWLARKLQLSVRELLLLMRLTGLEPFAAPDPVNSAILRLIHLVQALKAKSFKSAVALYLVWNQDLSGKSAPDPVQVAAFARTLRTGLAAVEAEFAVGKDPDVTVAQTRMAMVYGADAASFFFGLLDGSFTVKTDFSDPDGTMAPGLVRTAIETAAGKTDAGFSRIAYDDFHKQLSYSGVLTDAIRKAIETAAGSPAAAFKLAVDKLYDSSQAAVNPFFARYPELQAPYGAYVGDTADAITDKRAALLGALLPELILLRKKQVALQSLSAAVNTDPDFAKTMLDSPAAPLHAAGHTDQGAVNDLLAISQQALSAQFFAGDTAAGTVIASPDIVAVLDYAPAPVGNPLPANPTAGAAISGIWSGYIEAPESGFFNLTVSADAGATVTMSLNGKAVNLKTDMTDPTLTIWQNSDAIELVAGKTYPFTLTIEKVLNKVRVQWDWSPKGQGRVVIPSRYLYPATVYDRFQGAFVRFLKAASLASGLGLTAGELAHFATHPDYQIGADGWLNTLSVGGDPASATAAALLKPLEALLEFARIKAQISPNDESLLAVLNDPAVATQNADSLLFTITNWNQAALSEVLARFSGNITGLSNFDLFTRVYDAFSVIQKIGVSAQVLFQATFNEPTGAMVRDLQSALSARYDAASWRDVIKPINDEMRSLQRDALVAYILHQMHAHPESAPIDTPDKLFEYFLMDVQMDPCMQTSRIRHALSSVQLFIDRSLLNLEPRVSPAAIDPKRWEWMKRYRVWEANRKVYLHPENWLEPELRDDKSPFFKEIESELLQSDITEDSAATALLNYLAKLEEVAKLEPCAIYCDEEKDTDHVVARTAGANRKYYYRRREGRSWTPWDQIKLDIEDNPVIPVVWNGRLLLFWLRILKLTPDGAMQPPSGTLDAGMKISSVVSTDSMNVSIGAVLCWSEYYNGKWQATKTSDVNDPAAIGDFPAAGVEAFDRSKLWLSVSENGGALSVWISGEGSYSGFLLYNTHSLPVRQNIIPSPDTRFRYLSSAANNTFSIIYGTGNMPLYRLYSQWSGDHFYTMDAAERAKAISDGGYKGEGISCYGYNTQVDGTTPLYRLYNTGSGDHFYTTDATECDSAIANSGYSSEGIACYVYAAQLTQPAGILPLYRLYNAGNGDHFYTTDSNERDHAVSADGYKSEGVACYVLSYRTAVSTQIQRNVLKCSSSATMVEPHQPLSDPWSAPFFFADSRHVFYVTTTETPTWVGGYNGIGFIPPVAYPVMQIPPLVMPIVLPAPQMAWEAAATTGLNAGAIDPAPIRQFVSGNSYIHQGIGTIGSVMYGDAQIAPAGAIQRAKNANK